MIQWRNIIIRTILLLFLLLIPLPVLAIPTVSLTFVGNNSFLLSGRNLEDVGRIEAAVGYDSSSLANPRLMPKSFFEGAEVTLGGDAGGTVLLTVTSSKPLKGNGAFAIIAFDPIGTSVGTIGSLKGRVYGANGASQSVIFDFTNPTPQLDPSDPDDAPMIIERESKGQSFMGGEVSYLPPEATPEAKDTAASAGENAGDSQAGRVQEKGAESSASQVQCVLERFRLFKGERTPKNLMALFDAARGATFSQNPPIFLSDGKGSVRVTISRVTPGKAPNFTFRSARCVSIRKVSEKEWLVEVKPDKGMLKAGIMFLDDGKLRDIPLTVSPKVRVDLITPGKVTEADFALFLKERGTARAPRFDLNGDGKRDYLDDYIFTANYLAVLGNKKKKGIL